MITNKNIYFLMDTEEVKNGHKFPISMNMKNGLEFRET